MLTVSQRQALKTGLRVAIAVFITILFLFPIYWLFMALRAQGGRDSAAVRQRNAQRRSAKSGLDCRRQDRSDHARQDDEIRHAST